MMLDQVRLLTLAALAVAFSSAGTAQAQPNGDGRPPQFDSVEVSPERKITFRIHSPSAESVRLVSSDLPGVGGGVEMKKDDAGVWEATVGPVPAGAYRYGFLVDGQFVIDPRNPRVSEANMNPWSLAEMPGSETSDALQVPHGAVAEVTYYSTALKRHRRMHVYTPPGYERSESLYPVLFLLHGATDSDDSWSSVGRAGFILDNLIAASQAKPMIVVMPMGHTGPFTFGASGSSFQTQMDEFQQDFEQDIRPYMLERYRVKDNRQSRAIAGLSMGGAQSLNAAVANLKDFGYIGVFSSGVFGIAGGFGGQAPSDEWEQKHLKVLDDAELKEGLRLVWFATGKNDFIIETTRATVEMLKKHGFDVTYKETDGGHTWLNWREYLSEFATLLFQED